MTGALLSTVETFMADDRDEQTFGSGAEDTSPDPLGIIGWSIGGKYKIQSHLGGGGFGEVYAGYNENLPEQRVVIKFFKRVQAREKFAKEAKILCMLDHPNIGRVIDFLPDEGAVVVSFIDGKDGAVMLKQSGALPERLFLNVARSITGAISYAHEKKIAHRDLKPGNIMIDRSENVYLIDFGIAKEMGTEATKTAYTALTPMFAAPERQMGDKDYNPFLSDIYEAGVTLFNFATDSLPYRNPANPDINEWGGPAAKRLSPELTRILKKATHPIPKRRYSSAAELAEEFRNLRTAYGKGKKKAVLPIAAAAVIVLAVLGYFLLNPSSERPSSSSIPTDTTAQSPVTKSTVDEPAKSALQQTSTKQPTTSGGVSDQEAKTVTPQTQKPETVARKDTVQTEKPTPPKDTKSQEQIAVKEQPPAPPPPPPMSQMLIRVTPSDILSLHVDGVRRRPDERFETKPGSHQISVIHENYPVFQRKIETVAGPADFSYNLAEEFKSLDTVDLQVALIPPSDNHILEIVRNGRKQSITNFPYLGLKQLTGEWSVQFNIKPVGAAGGQTAAVDSAVILPLEAGSRYMIRGGSGILKVGSGGEKVSVARLLIYWTQK